MSTVINADLDRAVIARSGSMDWTPSPSKLVVRKRFFLLGPPEAGQVTSLVRYIPGARFPAHGHPDGEEILVLDGVFTDHTGDWPAGSWLLNPEGFRHAPSSVEGCLLFVKLRQYTGREHKAINVGDAGWQGIESRVLDERPTGRTRILALPPGEQVSLPARGAEGFILEGGARVMGQAIGRHDWFRAPPGSEVLIESEGCSLYLDDDSASRLMAMPAAGRKTQIT